jgi:selenocysteine-specific elongation factor
MPVTRSIVVGTAGHIDHGKSALVLALTGTDPDRLKEEKARGITIDLGFAHQTIDGITFSFVDVPGHERFVKNMLAGAGGIDLVVLVVAADESVMPQTREHFDICRLLRVSAGLVVLAKADLVDAGTLERTRSGVRDLVAGSFLDGAPIVPVSARTGAGLDAFRAALVDVSRRAAPRAARGATRLPVDRVFSMKGFGTVVTGTLVSGTIAVDQTLAAMPGDRLVKVRGVQVHGEKQTSAAAGQRSAVNLSGVDVEDLARGQSLVTPGAFVETRLADALVELLPDAKPLVHGARVRFHQGTAEILARVAIVGQEGRAHPAHPAHPADPALVISPGSRGFVRLRLEAPAILVRGDRGILRAYSPPVTLAGALVLDPRPPRTAIRTAAALERCRRLLFDPAADDRVDAELRALRVMIGEAGRAGLPLAALTSRAGVEPGDVPGRVAALVAARDAVQAGDVLVAQAIVEGLPAAIVAALAAHHAAQPLSDGVPRGDLRTQLFGRGHPAVFERALDDLARAGTLVARDRVALATYRLALSPEEELVRLAMEEAYRGAGLTPPDAAVAAAGAGLPAVVADRMLKLLLRQKVLVRVDALVFHDAALKQLKADVMLMKAAAGAAARLDVATFKERFGVTRKFAIPLLEYLDRERLTRRVGDSRVLL